MRVEVMEHHGLTQPVTQADYYETAHHKQLIKDIRGTIEEGRLVAVSAWWAAAKPSRFADCSNSSERKRKSS